MPVLVLGWAAQRIGLASATYTFGLLVGEIVPVTWPLRARLSFLDSEWQSQLFMWSIPVMATAAAVAILRPCRYGHLRQEPIACRTHRPKACLTWGLRYLLG